MSLLTSSSMASSLLPFALLFILHVSLSSAAILTTLDGPFEPVTVPFDQSLRGFAVDLPDTDPRVQRRANGFEPEQISVSLSADYDSVWISWITGQFSFFKFFLIWIQWCVSFFMYFLYLFLNGVKCEFVYFQFCNVLGFRWLTSLFKWFCENLNRWSHSRAGDLSGLHDLLFIREEIWRQLLCGQMAESIMFAVIDLEAGWDGACNNVIALCCTCRNQYTASFSFLLLLFVYNAFWTVSDFAEIGI